MKSTHAANAINSANFQRPRGEVLKGQFVEILRSDKGKIKGLVLRAPEKTYAIKLPKYLRPILVRELAPSAFVQVWAYHEDDRWRGINIMPLAEPEASALREVLTARIADDAVPAPTPTERPLCVQVCRKGTCFKRGGKQLLQALQAEAESNPDLAHVTVEGVGCLKECKKGPNVRLSGSRKVVTGATPQKVLSMIGQPT